MINLKNADMRQSEFDDVNFSGTRFHNVNLRGAEFSNVDLSNAVLEDLCLAGVEIRDARGLESMKIEGISVAELLEAWRADQPA